MKSFLFISIFLSFAMAQPKLTYKEITNEEQIRLFNNIEILAQKDFESFRVRVLGLDHESGSAGKSNCEVLTTIYIAISEYDEEPEQKLFKIESLYSPKILKILEEKSMPIIYLSFRPTERPQYLKIKVVNNKILFSWIKNKKLIKTKD